MTQDTRVRLFLAASAAALTAASAAYAADAPPAAQAATTEEIVVTGTAGGAGVKKLEAGYSITTIQAAEITRDQPKSSAELLTHVPGVWVESSGGVGTANVFVRGIPTTGDAPFVTMQFNGVPVYPAPTLSFMDNSALVRVDETVSGVEAVQGGPGMVFSNGQPGLTTNFTLKEGGEETSGEIKASTSDYDLKRVDFVLSGKLADDLYYMIGGYAASSPGVRDAQFNSEEGKQFTVNITKRFERGKFNVFARYTDDHGEWYLPFAIHVPGLDLGTYNELGDYTRYATLQVSPTSTETFDFQRGRGWKGVVAGASLTYDLGEGFTFRDRFGVTDGNNDTLGLVPDGNAVAASDVAAVVGHSVATVHSGQTLGAGDYVQNWGHWVVEKKLKAITNEMSLEKTFGDHNVTAGYYFTHFSSDDFWSLGNFVPLQVKSHGDYVNVTCANLQAAGSGSGCWFYGIRSSGTAESNAGYIADSWQVTQALRLDAAFRYEKYKLDYSIQTGPGYPDNNPADFSISHLSVTKASYTVGGNYMLSDTMGVFARYSKGTHFPSFDDVRGGDFLNEGVQSYEAGYKFHTHAFDAYVTGFYDKVKNAFLNDVGGITQLDDTEAKGVEFDGRWTSDFGFGVNGNATIQDTKITKSNVASFQGHKAPRQPKWQLRVSPTYDFDVGPAHATLYGTYFKTDKRFSDSGNLQSLPSYDKVDLGAIVEVDHLTFQVVADNVGNSHGLTEGDPRAVLTANARPILGRSVTFSVGYKF